MNSNVCHVFEVTQKLPKFSTYVRTKGRYEDPVSYVSFSVPERINRVIMWTNQSFIIDHPLDNQLDETFISLKDGKVLKITMKGDGKVLN